MKMTISGKDCFTKVVPNDDTDIWTPSPDVRMPPIPELPEWSLFRRKVSIETILQKLVLIWSLFAPKSLFFEFLGPNNASKTTQILLDATVLNVKKRKLSVDSEHNKKSLSEKKS